MLIEVLSSQQQAIEEYSLAVSPITGKNVLPQTVIAGEEQLHRLRQMSAQSEDIFSSVSDCLHSVVLHLTDPISLITCWT